MKNRWIKIALLGFCVLGLAGCEIAASDSYTRQRYPAYSIDEMIAVFQYLPAQKIAVAVKDEAEAEEFVESIIDAPNTKSAEIVKDENRILIIVETYGERAISLEEFEEIPKETTTSTEKP